MIEGISVGVIVGDSDGEMLLPSVGVNVRYDGCIVGEPNMPGVQVGMRVGAYVGNSVGVKVGSNVL